jgi:hypothetical protein
MADENTPLTKKYLGKPNIELKLPTVIPTASAHKKPLHTAVVNLNSGLAPSENRHARNGSKIYVDE